MPPHQSLIAETQKDRTAESTVAGMIVRIPHFGSSVFR
jgi:hypothetical protein